MSRVCGGSRSTVSGRSWTGRRGSPAPFVRSPANGPTTCCAPITHTRPSSSGRSLTARTRRCSSRRSRAPRRSAVCRCRHRRRRGRWPRPGRRCRSSTTSSRCWRSFVSDGWRLAVLTNCDEDLFAVTHQRFQCAVRPGAHGRAGAWLQAGAVALPRVRAAHARRSPRLGARGEQLVSRHRAGAGHWAFSTCGSIGIGRGSRVVPALRATCTPRRSVGRRRVASSTGSIRRQMPVCCYSE